MKDLTVILEDKPGALADLGDATGGANINIEGMCATSGGGTAELHVLVEDAVAAREALGSAGIDVDAPAVFLALARVSASAESRPARQTGCFENSLVRRMTGSPLSRNGLI